VLREVPLVRAAAMAERRSPGEPPGLAEAPEWWQGAGVAEPREATAELAALQARVAAWEQAVPRRWAAPETAVLLPVEVAPGAVRGESPARGAMGGLAGPEREESPAAVEPAAVAVRARVVLLDSLEELSCSVPRGRLALVG
jgi:hypothetical protein